MEEETKETETDGKERTPYAWEDDTMRGIRGAMSLLRNLFYERAQLYGTIIKLMSDAGITEFTTNVEEMAKFGLTKYILFFPDGENLKVELKDQVHEVKDGEQTS